IAEVFGERQVGSSTMPHKRNPINFENVKSLYKECMPRMVTRYLDQISEHQRDLTNSASSRFVPEIIAALYLSAQRLTKVMSRLVVDKEALSKNFLLTGDMVAAEPMYILLAFYGHPDAHEYVRKKTLESQKTGRPLHELVLGDRKVQPYCAKLTPVQKAILKDPGKYRGIAAQKAERVCTFWKKRLVEFSEPCAKGPEKS
ncbi:adenylosuccinate lyase, partial [Candidatus Woesearchaeota archaeon CG_4_10_14_0_8_um_filter_47_5]